MKWMAAIAIFCISMFSSVSAEFYVEDSVATLPPDTTSLQYFIHQQIDFMSHLENCEEFNMKVRNPAQPALLIVKEILGMDKNYCHVRTLTYPANQENKGLSASVLDCHLSKQNIERVTAFSEYEYIRNLEPVNIQTYNLSAISPTLELPKNTCK
jgi:hypothetical protein